MPARARKTVKSGGGIGFLEIGFIAAGLGIIYWYFAGHSQDGRDLWPALGFPYGATGNLPGIGGDFKTGNVTGALRKGAALPVTLNTAGSFLLHQLTDIPGVVLTDVSGLALTDVSTAPPPQLVTSRNAAGILDTFNHRGSRPS